MIKDTEIRKDVSRYAQELGANTKVIELIKIMQPMDIVQIFHKKLDLHPRQAITVLAHLLINNKIQETMSSLKGTVTNEPIPYPVPAVRKSQNQMGNLADTSTSSEDELGNIANVDEDYTNTLPIYQYDNWQFPQQAGPQDSKWPYDPETILTNDPHSKHKRSLEAAIKPPNGGNDEDDNILNAFEPLKTSLAKNQPRNCWFWNF